MHVYVGGTDHTLDVSRAQVRHGLASVFINEHNAWGDQQRSGCIVIESGEADGWSLVDTLQDAALKLIAALMEAGVDRPDEHHKAGLDASPALVGDLRALGGTYGPLGVALVAAHLSDPTAVVTRLVRSDADRATALAADEDDADRYVRGVGA